MYLSRQIGAGVALLAVLTCVAAAVQEPSFFRYLGSDMAWPYFYATADIWCLLCCVAGRPPASTTFSLCVARAVACAVVSTLGVLGFLTVGVLVDHAQHAASPWGGVPSFGLRLLLLWIPMFLVAQVPMLADRAPIRRFLVLGAAFLVQTTLHPASLHDSITSDKLLASALATAGACVAMVRPAH